MIATLTLRMRWWLGGWTALPKELLGKTIPNIKDIKCLKIVMGDSLKSAFSIPHILKT